MLKRRSWQRDHEGGEWRQCTCIAYNSASVAHSYAVATYPSKYTRVSTCTSINALAPSHLRLFAGLWSLWSAFHLWTLSLSFSFSFSLFYSILLFSSDFLSLAQHLLLYRLLLLNILLPTPAAIFHESEGLLVSRILSSIAFVYPFPHMRLFYTCALYDYVYTVHMYIHTIILI